MVRLPLQSKAARAEAMPAGEPAPQAARRKTSKPKRRTILVVDDNVDAATTLAFVLSSTGYKALRAHDAPSGLELARTRNPDAIVMDLGMPGMSGYEMAKLIRGRPAAEWRPAGRSDGVGSEEARRESSRAGFDHHLVKPVELSTLREILDRPNPRRRR